MMKYLNIFTLVSLFCMASCVKETHPPDCKKPSAPQVQGSVTVNDGSPFQLTASGSSNVQYVWTGPNGFYSENQNPQFQSASLANNGTYWVKTLVGYCYSDSVATTVHVKSDTTCALGDNYCDFPNGSSGPFPVTAICASGSSGYRVNAYNADSTMTFLVKMSQKPSSGGEFMLTDNPNPANGQIYVIITDKFGNTYTNTKKSPGYVKVGAGKINIVICQDNFEGIGVFSANFACH